MEQNNSVAKGLAWKLMERFGVQGTQFVLQVVLARILSPEHYGVLSLMLIFTALANVFIQQGFNTALIQNKDVTEEDYSSVLWISLSVAALMYAILYVATPAIAAFYEIPELINPFRVLCLMLFPGAVNSVQLARISRAMDFKKVFYSNLAGILISGIVGIVVALMGGGLWALVVQTILNTVIACIVMLFSAKFRLYFRCDLKRIAVLFAFGGKLMLATLLDTLYQDIRSLVIGKKYNADTLGYHDRGKQFPQFLINCINSAVQSVLLPAMSAEQDDRKKVKALMRYSVMLSSYIIFPMMAGLAGVAAPMITLLLTEKWLPCVPYLQIYCFILAFVPVHTSNLQAINAVGRSDIFLKLELIKKALGLSTLVFAVFCFDSPIAIVMTGAVTALISCFINASPNKKLIDYSYFEQIKDILPAFLSSIAMFVVVSLVGRLALNTVVILILQVLTGIVMYVALSAIFRIEAFGILLDMIKKMARKRT